MRCFPLTNPSMTVMKHHTHQDQRWCDAAEKRSRAAGDIGHDKVMCHPQSLLAANNDYRGLHQMLVLMNNSAWTDMSSCYARPCQVRNNHGDVTTKWTTRWRISIFARCAEALLLMEFIDGTNQNRTNGLCDFWGVLCHCLAICSNSHKIMSPFFIALSMDSLC